MLIMLIFCVGKLVAVTAAGKYILSALYSNWSPFRNSAKGLGFARVDHAQEKVQMCPTHASVL